MINLICFRIHLTGLEEADSFYFHHGFYFIQAETTLSSSLIDRKMAALFGNTYFWNASANMIMDEFARHLTENSHGQATTFGILYILLSVITVVGNALVIVAVWKDPLKILKTSPTNLILLSLAIADLTMGLFVIPGAASWYLRLGIMGTGPWRSQLIILIFRQGFLIVSVGHVLFLTVDRYFALATPLKYRTKITRRTVVVVSASIWICGISQAVVTSILHQYLAITWFISIVVIFLLAEAIYVLYLIILRHLMKHSKARILLENSQSNIASLHQRERKVFRVLVSVVFAFDSCCTPWMAAQALTYFCKACHSHYNAVMTFYNVTTVLMFANSALNPLLYSWRFSKFRATFKHFWRKFVQKGRRNKTVRTTVRSESLNTPL